MRISDVTESGKLDRIRAIVKSGKAVEHFVLCHELTEHPASEVEAAVIDFVGIPNLSNLQAGLYFTDFGIKTTEEVSAMYLLALIAVISAALSISL